MKAEERAEDRGEPGPIEEKSRKRKRRTKETETDQRAKKVTNFISDKAAALTEKIMKDSDQTLPRPYLNSSLEDPAGHFNGLLETDSSDRRNPRSEPSLSITGLLV